MIIKEMRLPLINCISPESVSVTIETGCLRVMSGIDSLGFNTILLPCTRMYGSEQQHIISTLSRINLQSAILFS